jgi:glycosyltransferase involved in cell wall biosynthesis
MRKGVELIGVRLVVESQRECQQLRGGRRMKLCYLADNRSIHTKRWVEYFSKENEVHLISMDYPTGQLDIDVHETHLIPSDVKRRFLNEVKVQRLVKDIKPDLLHAHFATQYGYWGSTTNFHPFVVSCWGDDVLIHPHQWPLSMLVKKALKDADLVTCDELNSVIAAGELTKAPRYMIPHGIDLNQFKVHYDPLSKVVIYMRGFEPVYDWETFVHVVHKVAHEVPSVRFIVIGGGSQMEVAKQALERCPSVRFLGPIEYQHVPGWLQCADVYVSTSVSEGGMALSTIEAMASGVVPVVTDVGDNKHTIINWVNGFVCPVGDAELLATRIVTLLKEPEMRKMCGEANRKWVETSQDYNKCMEQMSNLYRGLL